MSEKEFIRRGSRLWGGRGLAARAFPVTTAEPDSCGWPRNDTSHNKRRRCCWTVSPSRSATGRSKQWLVFQSNR